jgi:hypothetical protein
VKEIDVDRLAPQGAKWLHAISCWLEMIIWWAIFLQIRPRSVQTDSHARDGANPQISTILCQSTEAFWLVAPNA